jgi:hypothetical protein
VVLNVRCPEGGPSLSLDICGRRGTIQDRFRQRCPLGEQLVLV